MTDTRLYFALGLTSLLFALNFVTVIWQSRSVEKTLRARIDALEGVMNAKFEAAHQGLLRVDGVLDALLKHLKDR